jgi:hypothetical protein
MTTNWLGAAVFLRMGMDAATTVDSLDDDGGHGAGITNAVALKRGKNTAILALPMEQIIAITNLLTNDELHRVDKLLFAHAIGRDIYWIDSTPQLRKNHDHVLA